MDGKIIKILIIVLIFLPIFSFAALDLENIYPKVPGIELTLTSSSTLGDAIKYFASWFIFIGAIVAFGSLIYAGILYLSSTAKPDIMREAQTRIFKSFLGLTILLGSYLILVTINPELIVMRAERKPIVSGVLLLNVTSTRDIQSPTEGRTVPEQIEKCISDGDAYYLSSDIKDAEKEFGKFIKVANDEVNFENFEVKAIAFLEKGGKSAKTIAYHEKDFLKQIDKAEEYIYEGRIDQFGDLITTEYPIPVPWIDDKGEPQIMQLFDNSASPSTFLFHIDKVDFRDPGPPPSDESENMKHPPLSFEVKNIWPGIYLYTNKVGEERYLNSSEKDFSAIDFNDKTEKIGVHNQETDKVHDFLSILYEDKNFYDRFRMFFVKKERSMPGTSDNGNTWSYYEDESTPGYISPGNLDNIEMGFPLARTDNSERESLEYPSGAYTDQYGKVKKPSSAQIFEIDGDNPTTCQEVRICTKPGFLGSCIVYTPLDRANHRIEQVDAEEGVFIATSSDPANHTALPIYTPKNIENMDVAKIDETGVRIVGLSEDREFMDNIFSIKITGDCIVALFQNKVDDRNATDKTFWDNKTPGNHSQIFTESQSDLSNFEICRCGGFLGLGNFRYGVSCASSIAIFPLKK